MMGIGKNGRFPDKSLYRLDDDGIWRNCDVASLGEGESVWIAFFDVAVFQGWSNAELESELLTAAWALEECRLRDIHAGEPMFVFEDPGLYEGEARALLSKPGNKLLFDGTGLLADFEPLIAEGDLGRFAVSNFRCYKVRLSPAEKDVRLFKDFAERLQMHASVLYDVACEEYILVDRNVTAGSNFWNDKANEMAYALCLPHFEAGEREALKGLFFEEWELDRDRRYLEDADKDTPAPSQERLSRIFAKADGILAIWCSYVMSAANEEWAFANCSMEEVSEMLGIAEAVDALLEGVPADVLVEGIERKNYDI